MHSFSLKVGQRIGSNPIDTQRERLEKEKSGLNYKNPVPFTLDSKGDYPPLVPAQIKHLIKMNEEIPEVAAHTRKELRGLSKTVEVSDSVKQKILDTLKNGNIEDQTRLYLELVDKLGEISCPSTEEIKANRNVLLNNLANAAYVESLKTMTDSQQ